MKENNASNENISHWKGQDIILFQEDLQQKAKGSISEKSFYSYFKNDPEKLPRIDILNLLSRYCGYTNWNDFKTKNNTAATHKKSSTYTKSLLLISAGIFLAIAAYFQLPQEHTFSFCFIDPDRNTPISKTQLDIIILNNSQSPFYRKSDSLGCFQWTTKDDFIHFVVKSPYHKTDTIYRTAALHHEPIEIRTDDYALMLHYYANGKVDDWKKRRQELDRIISGDATIFEILPFGLGIEIYSKSEFINKLTTPTQSLEAIEIIDVHKSEGQIIKLKFRIKS